MLHEPVEDFVRRAMGLMRIFDEVDQDRLVVRPGAPAAPVADLPLPDRAPVAAPPLDLIEPAETRAGRAEAPAPAAPRPAEDFAPVSPRDAAIDARTLPLSTPDAPVLPGAGVTPSAVAGGQVARQVEHGTMNQRLIEVAQSNTLDDRDLVGPGATPDRMTGLDGVTRLVGLAQATLADATAGTVVAGGAGMAGTPVPDDPAAPLAPGGNRMLNGATLLDRGGEIGMLAVLGDARLDTTLVQLNLLAGGEGGATGAGNLVTRIDFALPPVAQVAAAGPVGLSLSVVEGDFLDIHRITQTQVIDDRDVIGWSETAHHLRIATGGNLAGNIAGLDLSGKAAEIVIVLGDYVVQREIVQVNIADDADLLSGGAAGAAGGTLLENRATLIQPAATQTLAAMPEDVAALVASLVAGDEPEAGVLSRYDADGDGTVEALLVRGDYIDIRSVRQVNLLADADVLLGLPAAAAEPAEAGGGARPVPANSLSNEAVLFDASAGARESYLAGQRYETTLLLDANLLGDAAGVAAGHAPDVGGGLAAGPAALADAIFFDAPTWGT